MNGKKVKKIRTLQSVNYRRKTELAIIGSSIIDKIHPVIEELKSKTNIKENISNTKSSEYLKSLNYIQQKANYDIFTDDCSCGHHKYDHGPGCDHCECRRFIA